MVNAAKQTYSSQSEQVKYFALLSSGKPKQYCKIFSSSDKETGGGTIVEKNSNTFCRFDPWFDKLFNMLIIVTNFFRHQTSHPSFCKCIIIELSKSSQHIRPELGQGLVRNSPESSRHTNLTLRNPSPSLLEGPTTGF